MLVKVLSGVAISLMIMALLTAFSSVSLDELLGLGSRVLLPSAVLAGARLLVQGLRFALLSRHYLGLKVSWREAIGIRVGSEAISLSVPSYLGGEPLRFFWLRAKGAPAGLAIWALFYEVMSDVVLGSSLAIIASFLVLWRGEFYYAAILFSLASFSLGGYLLLALALLGRIKWGRWWSIISRLPLPKEASRELEGALDTVRGARFPGPPLLLLVASLTLLLALLAGAILWVASGGGALGLLPSLLAVYASYTLGSLPVTPGGSGLTEVGAYLFTYPYLKYEGWVIILVWRFSSYHIPLAFSSPFLLLHLSRFLKRRGEREG